LKDVPEKFSGEVVQHFNTHILLVKDDGFIIGFFFSELVYKNQNLD
jgi:hypothetical protein